MSLGKLTISNLKKGLVSTASMLLLTTTSYSFANNELPDLGTAAVNTFSLEKEIVYGDAYMRIIRSQAPILSDPVLNQYITEIGNRLVAHATGVKTPFYFFLLQNDEINAFAFFGGHVAVHTGLFLAADTESELASVLAHEITHVTQRHLARSLEVQQKTNPATIAGLLGSILLAIAVPQAGLAALATTQALSAQTSINYTRLHEKEADRIGMQVLVDSGFDPESAASFFGKLVARYRFTTTPPQMLLTHPLPESRVAEARNRAAQYPHKYIPDGLNFHLAKSRIQVRFSSSNTEYILEFFKGQLKKKSYAFKEAADYGYALALFKNKQYSESEKIIDRLLKKDPNNLFYLDTKTDILVENNAFDDAINLLTKEKKIKPTSQVINANLANVYIENKQAKKAIPLLEDMAFLDKNNTLPYALLAEAYNQIGDKSQEHIAKAESFALRANYSKAIDQLNHAYKASNNNPLQTARIEAKIRQYRLAKARLDSLKG